MDDLEVRFLGNHDPNLHFALLTDLPDSPAEPREDNSLVNLCSDLIRGLTRSMPDRGMGSFFLLHRHRIYNPRERLWMGWERKRGKLMDLNNLLRGKFDSFPVKVGDLSLLLERSLRHHARFRHRTASRIGAPHGGSSGASAESGDH